MDSPAHTTPATRKRSQRSRGKLVREVPPNSDFDSDASGDPRFDGGTGQRKKAKTKPGLLRRYNIEIFLLLFLGGVALALWMGRKGLTADIEPLAAPIEGYTISSFDGRKLGVIGPRGGRYVPFAELPDYFYYAVIATEDTAFAEHFGIDPKGIARALLANAKAGEAAQGGSTITQQWVKNHFNLGNDFTLQRKIEEALISVRLEGKVPKQQIFADYANSIYFGRNAYGISEAATAYFGKAANDLTPAECIYLVALIPSPNNYVKSSEALEIRRQHILDKLVEHKFLDPAYGSTSYFPLPALRPKDHHLTGGKPPLIRQYRALNNLVRKELKTLEFPKKIDHTLTLTLNWRWQERIQRIVTSRLQAIENRADFRRLHSKRRKLQAGVVVLDHSGAIKAMVTSRAPKIHEFNYATQAKRPSGSLLKPLILAKALDDGFLKPGYHLQDSPISAAEIRDVPESWPVNAYKGYRGRLTINEAIRVSSNPPFVRLGHRIGYDKFNAFLDALNLQPLRHDPSAFLGSGPQSLLDLAGAHLAIRNDGLFRPPQLIDSIRSVDGTALYKRTASSKARRVFHPRAAIPVRQALVGAVRSGTGRSARTDSRPNLAGKTGTSDGSCDLWFIGFDNNYLVAVWIGFEKPRQIFPGAYGGRIAAPLAKEIFSVLPK